MTDEKYYEPELNDYHLGMECQIMTKAGWGTGCFPDVFLLNSELDQYKEDYNKAAHAVVRVKRLDHTDIVAAGWKETSKTEGSNIYYIPFEEGGAYLRHYNDNFCTIEQVDEKLIPMQDLFRGNIRNPSELSVLMRQLGITK